MELDFVGVTAGPQDGAPKKQAARLSVLDVVTIFVEMQIRMDTVSRMKRGKDTAGLNDGTVANLAKRYGCKGAQIRKIGNREAHRLVVRKWPVFEQDLYHKLLEYLVSFERDQLFPTLGKPDISRRVALSELILSAAMTGAAP